MANTTDNLKEAFAGESQARNKYTFFAEKAAAAGQKQVARLFHAAAEAEMVHARNHLQVLGGIKSEKENLDAAVNGEYYEFTGMYPGFIDEAKKENQTAAVRSFDYANQVEQIHHRLFQTALKELDSGRIPKDTVYYVCPVCGNTVEGEAPGKCPICNTPGNKFKKID